MANKFGQSLRHYGKIIPPVAVETKAHTEARANTESEAEFVKRAKATEIYREWQNA